MNNYIIMRQDSYHWVVSVINVRIYDVWKYGCASISDFQYRCRNEKETTFLDMFWWN